MQGLNLFARAALYMAVCDRRRMTPAIRAGLLLGAAVVALAAAYILYSVLTLP